MSLLCTKGRGRRLETDGRDSLTHTDLIKGAAQEHRTIWNFFIKHLGHMPAARNAALMMAVGLMNYVLKRPSELEKYKTGADRWETIGTE